MNPMAPGTQGQAPHAADSECPEGTAPARVGASGAATALGAALTSSRRAVCREHPDHQELPVVYNDFLNGFSSSPSTGRVLRLVEAAADIWADIYCMDARRNDEEQGGWWDSLGEREPSVCGLPGVGLAGAMQAVHDTGMRPGLWLEPEMVGLRSPLAAELPPESFIRRNGARVGERGRYQLDFRHPAARAHLDQGLDSLVEDYGLGYLKLDYNVDTGAGTFGLSGPEPHGSGLPGHSHAMLDWATVAMDRHPGLIVEGPAAGGSRLGGASGGVFSPLSLTDQQGMLPIPPISAAAPLAVAPEQNGVWARVDGTMDDEVIAFSLAVPLASRYHLAGRIDTLSRRQRTIVRQALAAYAGLRRHIRTALPAWPLGLPGWRDEWVAQATVGAEATLVVVQRRRGTSSRQIPLPHLRPGARLETVFPAWSAGETQLDFTPEGAMLTVRLSSYPAARVYRILHTDSGEEQ